MEKQILNILNQLVDGQDKISQRLDIIENKLDSVAEQTADLTEFRTETNNQLQDIKDNLNNVEVITASNWKDIAKLKAIK